MEIDKVLISKLAHLARLELSEAESAEIQKDLNNILKMVEQLQQLDTKSVDPLVYINEDENVLREDKVKSLFSRSDALKNAPDHDGAHIIVPKVIDL